MIKTPLSTVIGGAFWTPSCTVIGGNTPTFDQQIQRLFSNGEQGFFYDPNDLSTMFQDAAGTVPVTEAGQPVGLMLDKSGRNNHAYQTVSASRPIFEQKPILGANFVTDSTLAEPSKWNTSAASGVSISGNKLIFNNVAAYNSAASSALNSAKLTVGKRYLLSYIISEYVSGAVRAQLTGGATINTTSFDKNGRVSLAITATARHSFIGFQSTVAGTTLNISEVYLQEVTGYLKDQNYLQFDGVDDFLQTNNIDFTATDKVSLFAGVRKNSSYVQILCELSSNMNFNDRSFYLTAPESLKGEYGFKARANAPPDPSMTAITQNTSIDDICVLSASSDLSADRNTIRRNGLLSAISYDLGTGNYGNYPLYIGRRAGTSFPFNGHLYSLIGIGRLTTDSETVALEKSIAKNTGVTLNV